MFEQLRPAVHACFEQLAQAEEAFFSKVCHPVLIKFFGPINDVLSPIYQPWATIVAITFFVGTMLWVWFVLKESYVNMGRPIKAWWTDLRVWTVISMLPHIFVYFYFY